MSSPRHSQVASAVPRAWPARAGPAPWASWARGLPWGQQPKGLPAKAAGRRGGGRGCAWGPRHPRVTVPAPGKAAVTMPRGRIKGGIVPCAAASLPGRQPADIREGVLEEPVECLGGRKAGGWTRLLEVLRCKASCWRAPLQSPSDGWQSCLSPQGTGASSSGDERNQQAQWQEQGNGFWRST